MSKIHTNLLLNIFDFFGPPWTCLHQAYTRGSLAEHAWEMCPVTQSVKSQNGIPLRLQAGKVRNSSALQVRLRHLVSSALAFARGVSTGRDDDSDSENGLSESAWS